MLTTCSLVARAGGSEDEQVQSMADRLVEYARQCMKDRNRVSPFESAFFSQALFFLSFFYLSHSHWGFLPFFLADVFIGEASRQGMYFLGGVSALFSFMRRITRLIVTFLCFLFSQKPDEFV